jgi:hypothetical protein
VQLDLFMLLGKYLGRELLGRNRICLANNYQPVSPSICITLLPSTSNQQDVRVSVEPHPWQMRVSGGCATGLSCRIIVRVQDDSRGLVLALLCIGVSHCVGHVLLLLPNETTYHRTL